MTQIGGLEIMDGLGGYSFFQADVLAFCKDREITECLQVLEDGLIVQNYKVIMGTGAINKFSNKGAEEELYSKYSIVRRDILNSIVYLEKKDSRQEYIMKELTTNDQKSQFKAGELVRHKISHKDTFTLHLEDALVEEAQEYCTYKFKIYLIFQHPPRDLKLDILERRMKNQKYQEQELFNILVSVMKALKLLKQIDHPHQAVCSKNVYLFPGRVVKLSDPWLKTSNLEELPSYHIYSSPQKLEVVANSDTGYDWYLADLFSLGMLGLEVYYLEFMNDLYQDKTINQQLLAFKVESIRFAKFRQLIKGLLGPPRLRYQTVSDFTSEFTRKINVSPSPPKTHRIVTISPRHNQHKGLIPHRQFAHSHPFNSLNTQHTPILKSPERKLGTKINTTIPKRHNIRVMNVEAYNTQIHEANLFTPETRSPQHLKENKEDIYSQNPQKSFPYRNNMKPMIIQPHQLVNNHASVNLKPSREWEQTEFGKGSKPRITMNGGRDSYQTIINRQQPLEQSSLTDFDIMTNNPTPPIRNHAYQNLILPNQRTQPKPRNKTKTKTIPEVTQNSTLSLDEELDIQFQALKQYAQNQIAISSSKQLSYINGSYYQGGAINGLKEGYGKLYSPNDTVIYDGEWRGDQYHGFGCLRNSFISPLSTMFSFQNMNNIQLGWSIYEGEFYMGKKNGSGKLTLANGDMFQGDFSNDRMHGHGVYTPKNGPAIRGVWNNGYYVTQ